MSDPFQPTPLPRLKPCPFCGGQAQIVDKGFAGYSVGCHNPSCPVHPKATSTCDHSAARRWNTRFTPPVSTPLPPCPDYTIKWIDNGPKD